MSKVTVHIPEQAEADKKSRIIRGMTATIGPGPAVTEDDVKDVLMDLLTNGPKVSGRQPMSTAPRNGEDIAAFDGHWHIVCWSAGQWAGEAGGCSPYFWHPLPGPPTEDELKELGK